MANVTLQGNIGKTPELRRTRDGTPVLGFSLADNRKEGEEEKTEWYDVVLWEHMAEHYADKLEKGMRIRATGRLQGQCASHWRLRCSPEHHPYGSRIWIQGFGSLTVRDTGGKIKGPARFDVYLGSPKHCRCGDRVGRVRRQYRVVTPR